MMAERTHSEESNPGKPYGGVVNWLVEEGILVDGAEVDFEPLTGGVSSEILRVRSGGECWVYKRALEQLKTRDAWFADTRRNASEIAFLEYARAVDPEAVPRLVAVDEERRGFLMEYLGPPFRTWKSDLLAGRCDIAVATKAARFLGNLHALSTSDPTLAGRFSDMDGFDALRIDPYLRTTGRRHPLLRKYFEEEAERLLRCREALVHGDFSPKNILVGEDRMVLLDHEVAVYADPAFDVAFLLNHLLLKAFLLPDHVRELIRAAEQFWRIYRETRGEAACGAMEARIIRLLLLLMLARIDGKSPVEYFVNRPPEQDCVRSFVARRLRLGDFRCRDLLAAWAETVRYHHRNHDDD